MDTLIYLGGAIAFFVLVMASIALHEIGHLVPGKLFDVKTTQSVSYTHLTLPTTPYV